MAWFKMDDIIQQWCKQFMEIFHLKNRNTVLISCHRCCLAIDGNYKSMYSEGCIHRSFDPYAFVSQDIHSHYLGNEFCFLHACIIMICFKFLSLHRRCAAKCGPLCLTTPACAIAGDCKAMCRSVFRWPGPSLCRTLPCSSPTKPKYSLLTSTHVSTPQILTAMKSSRFSGHLW